MVDFRCISPLIGSFVAFDIVKVNPFNQMIDADPQLASLFYKQSVPSTMCNTTKVNGGTVIDSSRLCGALMNAQKHENAANGVNQNFVPRINKLITLCENRNLTPQLKSTVFKNEVPIFDALYELENGGP